MNWDAIGALAELLGAAGVIISIIYLARQVSHNTQATRLDATFRVMESTVGTSGLPLVNDAELGGRLFAALQGERPSDPGELLQVQAWCFVTLKTIENAFYQFQHGSLDPAVWQNWADWWAPWLRLPGFRAYWEDRRDVFLPDFREVVDSWMQAGGTQAMPGVGEAAKRE